jgi:hypothetical protein
MKYLIIIAVVLLTCSTSIKPLYIYDVDVNGLTCPNAYYEHHEVSEDCEVVTCKYSEGTNATFIVCDDLLPVCIASKNNKVTKCPRLWSR